MDDQSLNITDGDDINRVPKAKVENFGGRTRIGLPYEVYMRCNTHGDGRTHNFFTEPGEVHEGQSVTIHTYGEGFEPATQGIVQRASVTIPNKWFVQTPAQPKK